MYSEKTVFLKPKEFSVMYTVPKWREREGGQRQTDRQRQTE